MLQAPSVGSGTEGLGGFRGLGFRGSGLGVQGRGVYGFGFEGSK